MKIGEKEYSEILITDSKNNLLVSITDEDIIEEQNCKVTCVPFEGGLQQIDAATRREGHPLFKLHGKENGMLTGGENKWERPLIKNMKEFEALCGPVVKYLRNNGNPYTEVHISQDRITVTSVECGIPLNDNGGQSGMD